MRDEHDIFQTQAGHVRAGDADRERVAEILREQHLAGRLDDDELGQRIDACYKARTVGALDELLADLPRRDAAPDARAGRLMPRSGRLVWLLPIILVFAVAHAIVGATGGHHHFFWLAIPLTFLAVRWARFGGGRRPRAMMW